MKLKQFVMLSAALSAASLGFGQSATLAADRASVAAGSELTLSASVAYAATPGAMGWSITLPEGWSYVSTTGPDAPAIAPQDGATGTLEWAYTEVPANAANFRFTVRIAGKAGAVELKAKVHLRVDGKPKTVEVAPASVSVAS